MSRWDYRPGDCLAICDTCGFRFFLSELRKDKDGFMVCTSCYDPPHPQESIKTPPERTTIKDFRPEGTPRELLPGDVTPDDL